MLLEDQKSSSGAWSNELPKKWSKTYLHQISTPNDQNDQNVLTRFLEEDSFGVSLVKSWKFMAWSPWAQGCKSSTQNSYDYIHIIDLYHIHIISIHYSQYFKNLSVRKSSLVKRKVSWRHSAVKRLYWFRQLLKLWNKQKNIRPHHVKKSLYNENIENRVKLTFMSSLFSYRAENNTKRLGNRTSSLFSECIPAVCGMCWSPALHWCAPVPKALTTKKNTYRTWKWTIILWNDRITIHIKEGFVLYWYSMSFMESTFKLHDGVGLDSPTLHDPIIFTGLLHRARFGLVFWCRNSPSPFQHTSWRTTHSPGTFL